MTDKPHERPFENSSGGASNLSQSSVAGRTAEEIQDWFVERIAQGLEVSPDTIDVTAPFESLMLDSASAIEMTGDLEDWLGRTIDPSIIYDYPTIEALSKHLADNT